MVGVWTTSREGELGRGCDLSRAGYSTGALPEAMTAACTEPEIEISAALFVVSSSFVWPVAGSWSVWEYSPAG